MTLRMLLGFALSLGGVSGCATPSHIKDYTAKRRTYEPIVAEDPGRSIRDDGSLWAQRNQAQTLFTDVKAYGLNDIVTVRIDERASAERDAATELQRSGSFLFGADAAKKLEESGIASDRLLEAQSDNTFSSNGRTGRTEDVQFTVAATVTQVLPNGNVFLEGHRVVLVNNEEHHFYISGVARVEDIQRDNSITSSLLADAEIEFTGLGVLTEQQKPGWLTRFFQLINPM